MSKQAAKEKRPLKMPDGRPWSQMTLAEMDQLRGSIDSPFAPYVPLPAVIRPIHGASKYKHEYCQAVVEDAARGHTLGATAALFGVDRNALYKWADAHPEFAEALSRAKAIRQRYYEGHLIDMGRRGGDSTRFSAVKLGLINVGGEDWKEKLGSEVNVQITLASLITESMKLDHQADPRLIDVTPAEAPTTDKSDLFG